MLEKLKTVVTRWIENFVLDYQDKKRINFWTKPLVGFADAENPYILRLKEIVGPEHGLPKDVLPACLLYTSSSEKNHKRAAGAENYPQMLWLCAEE